MRECVKDEWERVSETLSLRNNRNKWSVINRNFGVCDLVLFVVVTSWRNVLTFPRTPSWKWEILTLELWQPCCLRFCGVTQYIRTNKTLITQSLDTEKLFSRWEKEEQTTTILRYLANRIISPSFFLFFFCFSRETRDTCIRLRDNVNFWHVQMFGFLGGTFSRWYFSSDPHRGSPCCVPSSPSDRRQVVY